jgi:hypothetical protein
MGSTTSAVLAILKKLSFANHFRNEKKSVFRCKLCSKVVLFAHEPLRRHLANVHTLSVHEYRKEHLSSEPADDEAAEPADTSLEGMHYYYSGTYFLS